MNIGSIVVLYYRSKLILLISDEPSEVPGGDFALIPYTN